MSPESSLFLSGIWWLIGTALTALWGAFCVWVATWLVRRAKKLPALRSRAPETPRAQPKRPGILRRFFSGVRLRDRYWTRAHRFDTTWIQRESGRGHACLVIFTVYFGLWILAVGLKEVFILSGAPLAQSPGVVILSALPMYGFEVAWLVYGGRAGQLATYRKKVRIWRWRTR